MNLRKRSSRRSRAFTIMEVLVALALTALLLGAVVSLVGELGRQRTLISANWRASRGTDAVIDRLERDIAFAIVGDAQRGSGIRGSSDSLAVLSRGVWVDASSGDASSPGPACSDLTRVEYHAASGQGGIAVLEAPAAATSARSGSMTDSSVSFRFRYFDGRTWLTEFDSLRRGRLPLAIEVTVWSEPSQASDMRATAPHQVPDRVRIISIPDAKGDGL